MSVRATNVWHGVLSEVVECGTDAAPVSAGSDFKGRRSVELLAYQSRWPIAQPTVACATRNLGYKFMCAEAACILSGDNRLSSILPFSKHMERFTDDGLTLSGHYGPPFVEQVGHVVRTLLADRESRQAVMTVWRPRPGKTNDTPCTVALQWLVRDNQLHCVATMRSSDVWTGVPYDVFAFSMMTAHVALSIREAGRRANPDASTPWVPELGTLVLTAGSQHLYMEDWNDARQILRQLEGDDPRAVPLFDQHPLRLHEFEGPQALVDRLWSMARGKARGLVPSWGKHEVAL